MMRRRRGRFRWALLVIAATLALVAALSRYTFVSVEGARGYVWLTAGCIVVHWVDPPSPSLPPPRWRAHVRGTPGWVWWFRWERLRNRPGVFDATALLPLWPFAGLAGVGAAGLWWRGRRRGGSRGCPECDYDLSGLAAGAVCPECGAGASGAAR